MERVVSVDPLDGYKLNILFNNGERKVFDVSPYLSKGLSRGCETRSSSDRPTSPTTPCAGPGT